MDSIYRFKNSKQSGQSLPELMVALVIGSIVALTMATLFTFGIQQFGLLIEENKAEESLLESSFLLKSYLNQAVKIKCNAGSPAALGAATPTMPANVPAGLIWCNNVPAPPAGIGAVAWTPNQKTPFALFFRETGGATAGSSTGTTYSVDQTQAYNSGSTYMGTGIYFTPPAVNQSGVLSFVQQAAGTPNVATNVADVSWDHLVNVGVIAGSTVNIGAGGGSVEPFNLESLNIRLVARYYTMNIDPQAITYNPTAANNGFRDIEMIIPISFRDTFLGVSNNGTNTPERLYGSVYFFRFTSPPLTSFDF